MDSGYEKILEYAKRAYDRYIKLESLAAAPEIAADPVLYKANTEEMAALARIAALYGEWEQTSSLKERFAADGEDKRLTDRLEREAENLILQMAFPSAPGNATVSVRPEPGAEEYAAEYVKTLLACAAKLGCKAELKKSDSVKSKLKYAEICFSGVGSTIFMHESGIHAFTDGKAVRSVKVASFKSVSESRSFDEKDVKIELTHADGAGGQNVNKVETAIRAKHIPTSITVTCRDERSQLQNKKRALEKLKEKVEAYYSELVSAANSKLINEALSVRKRIRCYDLKERTLSDCEYGVRTEGAVSDAEAFGKFLGAVNAAAEGI